MAKARNGKRRRPPRFKRGIQAVLWAWQQGRCYLKGCRLPPWSPEPTWENQKCPLDHIHPPHRGGTNSMGNFAFACRSCDQKKQDRLPTACEVMFGKWAGEVMLVAMGHKPEVARFTIEHPGKFPILDRLGNWYPTRAARKEANMARMKAEQEAARERKRAQVAEERARRRAAALARHGLTEGPQGVEPALSWEMGR